MPSFLTPITNFLHQISVCRKWGPSHFESDDNTPTANPKNPAAPLPSAPIAPPHIPWPTARSRTQRAQSPPFHREVRANLVCFPTYLVLGAQHGCQRQLKQKNKPTMTSSGNLFASSLPHLGPAWRSGGGGQRERSPWRRRCGRTCPRRTLRSNRLRVRHGGNVRGRRALVSI